MAQNSAKGSSYITPSLDGLTDVTIAGATTNQVLTYNGSAWVNSATQGDMLKSVYDADNDGYTSCGGDCNDNNNAVRPNATELCNGIDDNCDGTIDNGTPALPGTGNMIGAGSVCKSTSGNVYSINPVAGATAYTWTLPTGATGTSTTNSISLAFSSTYAGGSICVTPKTNCVNGTQTCLTTTVVTARPAQPGTISGTSAGSCSTQPELGKCWANSS